MNNNQTEKILELKVDVNQFNTIIAGLEELPHKMSRRVIDSLVQQAQSQVQNQSTNTVNFSNKVLS